MASSESVPVASPAETHGEPVEYVGFRVDCGAVVLNLSEHRRLSPSRSLDVVNHSPSGFEWGYSGSGPAQLACGLLLDYYDDEGFVREHYIAFRNQVVSQLECDGPADCWHLTGEEIDAALATITDGVAAIADGGQPAPSLPANWRTVTRPDRRIFQRNDFDHYVVFRVGHDESRRTLISSDANPPEIDSIRDIVRLHVAGIGQDEHGTFRRMSVHDLPGSDRQTREDAIKTLQTPETGSLIVYV